MEITKIYSNTFFFWQKFRESNITKDKKKKIRLQRECLVFPHWTHWIWVYQEAWFTKLSIKTKKNMHVLHSVIFSKFFTHFKTVCKLNSQKIICSEKRVGKKRIYFHQESIPPFPPFSPIFYSIFFKHLSKLVLIRKLHRINNRWHC